MNKIFKDAFEGSWSDQVITDIASFFYLDTHEQGYILIRLSFDHPFLAICVLLVIFVSFVGIISSANSNIETYNSAASRQARLREKIENHNKIKTIIDSRTRSENEKKNILGGLFFGLMIFFVVSIILGRAFSSFLTAQQGWLLYLILSIASYLGVRKYKSRKYDKLLKLPDQENHKE